MTDRKTQIKLAATNLFLTEGLSVSTASIAKAAGVSNGTLFNVFPTKQDLIDTIFYDAKFAMFGALPNSGDAPFNRAAVRENWDSYLDWARAFPEDRQVLHLLLEAGLVSDATQAKVNDMGAAHYVWLGDALASGKLRGPSMDFIGRLIFFQIDLVITENLEGGDIDLAFDMLCNAIGLKE